MPDDNAMRRAPAELAIRDEYFTNGPKFYTHYVGLHNTPTASHPAIFIPDPDGSNPENGWPMLRYEVDALDHRFAPEAPSLTEDGLYLTVALPEFRLKATINVNPMFASDSIWQFGWITAISDFGATLHCHKTPTDEASKEEELIGRWELPYIHVPCSEGGCIPWFSHAACSDVLRGPCEQITIRVDMRSKNDRVMPRVPWRVLLPGGYVAAHKYCIHVVYFSWLVLRNVNTEAMHVVRTVIWERSVKINMDATKPIGSRCTFLEPLCDNVISDNKNYPLPEWATRPPYAHEELTFKAYPHTAHDQRVDGLPDSVGKDAEAIVVEGPNNHYLNLPKM